jgi:hypothetical protein
MFYVYKLEVVETGRVVYVGKGSGNRMYDHARAIRRGRPSQPLHKRLQKLVADGFSFRAVKVLETRTAHEALMAEDALIREYGKENLWNMYAGGGGCITQKRSSLWAVTETEWSGLSNVSIALRHHTTPASVRTFRCRHVDVSAPVRVFSSEDRERMRVISSGRKMSDETRRKMSESRTGHRHWRASRWTMTNPEGIHYKITGLAAFCRDHGLDYSKFSAGRRHRGWSGVRC